MRARCGVLAAMQPVAQPQQVAKRIWFLFWYYLHTGIEFNSTCGSTRYGDAAKKDGSSSETTRRTPHRNSQPFHELASLRNDIVAVAMIALRVAEYSHDMKEVENA
jgi:hypothetical protein